jgi:hypothetical protein
MLVIGLFAQVVCGGNAFAQEPAKSARLAKPDINMRYRMIEQYDTSNGRPPEGTLGTTRAAFKISIKTSTEQRSGAPTTVEDGLQVIFLERAAAVAALDNQLVESVIRRYETVRVTPPPPTSGTQKPYVPLQGMTLFIKPVAGGPPQILSLTPERPMHDVDFRYAAVQIWLPNLIYILPNTNLSASPKRVGESWPVVRLAATTLMGFPVQTGVLTAKLEDVVASPKGDVWTATIGITGQVQEGPMDAAVNARVLFSFAPPLAKKSADPASNDSSPENVVDCFGGITEIRMTKESRVPIDESSRLRRTIVQQFVLQRQLQYDGPPLEVPVPMPKPNEQNSWLTYADPDGRFEFRYDQALIHRTDYGDHNAILLRADPPEGLKRVVIHVRSDKDKFQPETLTKDVVAAMEKEGYEIRKGDEGWLPEADWPGMKVYHVELAATDSEGRRTHHHGYWVHLGQSPWFIVDSATTIDPSTPFRAEVETLIKSIKLKSKK